MEHLNNKQTSEANKTLDGWIDEAEEGKNGFDSLGWYRLIHQHNVPSPLIMIRQ
jgi:hypothetical protein